MNIDNWVHRANTMRCTTCIFFVPKPVKMEVAMEGPSKPSPELVDKTLGRCRRHSPTLGGWPAVFSSDWCGDHKLDENKI